MPPALLEYASPLVKEGPPLPKSRTSESAPRGKPSKGDAGRLTPAMRQYAEQKRQVGDAILLFRMGDFYETFYDDAQTVSRVLGIALTSRSKDADEPIPLAGIPYHALDSYLHKLVEAGFRVAISEQMEDARLAKGVVKREVVRVVTAGTLTDENLLDERTDNVLAAICEGPASIGIACIELASGRFEAWCVKSAEAIDELVRLKPAELLVDEERSKDSNTAVVAQELRAACDSQLTRRSAHEFVEYNAEQTLLRQFGVATLAGFGFEEMDASLRAAGAILSYLNETQRTALGHLRSIRPRAGDHTVQIDHSTWRSLEIDRTLRGGRREGSLLAAVDRTVHPGGARELRRWICAPLRDASRIHARQDAVQYLAERDTTRRKLRLVLKSMADVERIAARAALSRATPRDLAGLGAALDHLPELKREIGEHPPEFLHQLAETLTGLDDLAGVLREAVRPDAPPKLSDGGIIKPGYNAELDRLHSIRRDGQSWLARYQQEQSERSGIPSLKVGFNKVFGYYIEVSHAHQQRVPADYVRKQTIKNAERYITDDLKKFEQEVLTAEEKARAE